MKTSKANLQPTFELVHVGEPDEQHKRDEGVRAQEQESVAGVVLVVVGRSTITAGPHSGADESSKLNLAPHGPLLPYGDAYKVSCAAVSS